VSTHGDGLARKRADGVDPLRQLMLFAELGQGLDLEAPCPCERDDRLETAAVGARDDPFDRESRELVDERDGLPLPTLVERALAIVSLPLLAVSRLRVTDEQHRYSALRPRESASARSSG